MTETGTGPGIGGGNGMKGQNSAEVREFNLSTCSCSRFRSTLGLTCLIILSLAIIRSVNKILTRARTSHQVPKSGVAESKPNFFIHIHHDRVTLTLSQSQLVSLTQSLRSVHHPCMLLRSALTCL